MSVDIAIIVGFLSINLMVGIISGRGIKTIREYAIGNRNFSTATIAATIIATWIGGGFFSSTLSETYKEGLWHIVARIGDVFTLLIVGYFIAPRVHRFLGKISVAEIMGDLYGKNIRIVTAVASVALSIGCVAVQIKVISSLFSHFFGFSGIYAALASSAIITIYSAFGGIRSVTFTDIIQFFTFGVFIPIFALFIWNVFDSSNAVFNTLKTSELFDYNKVFNYHDPKFYVSVMLFLYFTIPGLDPATFQRILMAKNIKQVQQSFVISAVLCLFIGGMACFIGIILLSYNPNLDADSLVMYVLDNYSYPGIKGLTLIGIMAMVMSTADSYINSAAVIFSHDFCNVLKPNSTKTQLSLSRTFSVFSGALATILALSADSLFELLLLVGNFYTPIITMPLMLAILGFRTSSRVALTSMIVGAITVLIWRNYLQPETGIDSIIPGTIANLLCFLLSHYIFREPGGWSSIEDDARHSQSLYTKNSRKNGIYRFFINLPSNIKNLNLVEYFEKCRPKNEVTYSIFSLFSAASTLIVVFSLSKNVYEQSIYLINVLQAIVLFISTFFLCYKLWPDEFRKKYIGLIWFVSIFANLSCISSFFVLISKFSQISLVIFILNLSVIGMLLSWKATLAIILTGTLIAFYIYSAYIGKPATAELYDLKLKVSYIIFLFSSFMLAFLKPKQEYQALTEEKNEHLSGRITSQEKQVKEALALRSEFIRNVTHEYHAPMTGITSLAEVLVEKYDKLTEQQRRIAAENILKSSRRLDSFDENLSTLSKLCKNNYKLNLTSINLSNLVYERIEICRKLYEENKEAREFILDIQDNLMFKGDEYYLTQALDNLVINAITYCTQGKITIKLKQLQDQIHFAISDEGVGIPPGELEDIFDEFVVSSRTRTPAGGRGVGLALCKRVVEVHGGEIRAESGKGKGAAFSVILPITKR